MTRKEHDFIGKLENGDLADGTCVQLRGPPTSMYLTVHTTASQSRQMCHSLKLQGWRKRDPCMRKGIRANTENFFWLPPPNFDWGSIQPNFLYSNITKNSHCTHEWMTKHLSIHEKYLVPKKDFCWTASRHQLLILI
jgi:hypothetical protein